VTSAHLRGLKCDHNLNSSPCHRCRNAPAIFFSALPLGGGDETACFYLRDERVRDNLIDYIRKLPVNDALPLVVKFSEADRTLAQNDLFHALCGDTAKQLQWAGKSRDLASWKVLYVSGHAIATGKPGEVVPGLEGEFCAIRESTAKMGIRRMTSLIEYSQAFAMQNGVQLREVRYSGDYFGRVA
jgi:NinB protein.